MHSSIHLAYSVPNTVQGTVDIKSNTICPMPLKNSQYIEREKQVNKYLDRSLRQYCGQWTEGIPPPDMIATDERC